MVTFRVISKCKHIICRMSVLHSCAGSSFWVAFLAFNGQAGPGLWSVCLIRYAIHGFSLVSLNQAPLSCFHSALIKKTSVCSVFKSLLWFPVVNPDESSVAATVAQIFSQRRQSGHETQIRHLILWLDRAGLTVFSLSIWPHSYLGISLWLF